MRRIGFISTIQRDNARHESGDMASSEPLKSAGPSGQAGSIRIKRVYATPAKSDGRRILVDRLWPRGMSKERARLSEWMKEIAPSEELRNWFHHNPDGWQEFTRRYRSEIARNHDAVAALTEAAGHGAVTLLFASADTEHNNAVVLRDYLEEMTEGRSPAASRTPHRPAENRQEAG